MISVWAPVYGALGAQDATALTALSERYPAFREAYAQQVSHHIPDLPLDDLPKDDLELVAAGAERCRTLTARIFDHRGHQPVDGAAFEALSGVVHFAPFLVRPACKSDAPLEDVTTSPNGFPTDKDSGGMFYVIRLS